MSAGQEAVLLISPGTPGADYLSVADKFRSEMSARGIAVTEVSVGEAQDIHQAALAGGSPTIVKIDSVNAKPELHAYDAASGKDISKTFFSAPVTSKPQPVVETKSSPAPVPVAQVSIKPIVGTPNPAPEPKPAVVSPVTPGPSVSVSSERSRLGIGLGMGNLKKNKDSLDTLVQNNSGADYHYDKAVGRFRLFYEHDFSGKYGIGFAAECQKSGATVYEASGKTLNLSASPVGASFYVTRRFGRHFGLYLGGGLDYMNARIEDPSNLAGISGDHLPFKAKIVAPNGEAGIMLGAGDLSLRFSVRKIFGGSSNDLSTSGQSAQYRLIVRDGKTLSYKLKGQALASNEKYFKLDFGGMMSAVTLNYAFAGW
jgi:hypothetical protein